MFQKLDAVEKRYIELTEKISDPEVIANQSEWRNLMKEHAEIEPIVEKYREYKKVKQNTIDIKPKVINVILLEILFFIWNFKFIPTSSYCNNIVSF